MFTRFYTPLSMEVLFLKQYLQSNSEYSRFKTFIFTTLKTNIAIYLAITYFTNYENTHQIVRCSVFNA